MPNGMLYRILIDHIRRLDWILIAAYALPMLFSVYALYSLAIGGGSSFSLFWKQGAYGIGGMTLAIAISFINPHILKKQGVLLLAAYGTLLLALAGLLVFGQFIRGSRALYHVGSFGIAPVEFVKIAFIVLLAKFFSDRHVELYTARHLLISFGYLAGALFLVLAQPDAGSALVLICLWLGIVCFTGVRFRWMLTIVAAGIFAFVLTWNYGLASYQKNRVRAFLNPVQQSHGFGYNTIQSQVAIGSGGFFGRGVGAGSQGANRFLPEAPTDFILAFIVEERGLLAGFILFTCFGVLWYRSLRIGIASRHNFGLLFAFGFVLLTAIHFFMNVGMQIGLLPVIGIPLPMVSYGGSHVLAGSIGFGILLALGAQKQRT